MTYRSRLIPFALAVFLGAACQRIVEVEVPDPVPVLVVEGRIERLHTGQPSVQRVRLTLSAPAFGSAPPPPAMNAIVSVSDGSGVLIHFEEISGKPGHFESAPFLPSVGETYTLQVEYDGDSYRASDVLRPVPPIDSLYFEYRQADEDDGAAAGYRAVIDYMDLPDSEDFYFWEQSIDGGESIMKPDPGNEFTYISSDKTYPGGRITGFVPYGESVVERTGEVEIRQYAVTRETFDFLREVLSQSASGGGTPFDVPQESIRSNVSNVTDPNRRALGHFFAAEVAVATGVAPDTTP